MTYLRDVIEIHIWLHRLYTQVYNIQYYSPTLCSAYYFLNVLLCSEFTALFKTIVQFQKYRQTMCLISSNISLTTVLDMVIV